MEYKIQGEPMPVVTCHLEAGESMITQGGSMVWMSPNMEMQTMPLLQFANTVAAYSPTKND